MLISPQSGSKPAQAPTLGYSLGLPVKSAHNGLQGRTRRLHLHLRSLRFTVPKLLGVLVQVHAALLLAERLHLAEQNFLFSSIERVTPAFFRTVSLAEVQFQRVTQTILLHVIVGVNVEPVVVLIGADKAMTMQAMLLTVRVFRSSTAA